MAGRNVPSDRNVHSGRKITSGLFYKLLPLAVCGILVVMWVAVLAPSFGAWAESPRQDPEATAAAVTPTPPFFASPMITPTETIPPFSFLPIAVRPESTPTPTITPTPNPAQYDVLYCSPLGSPLGIPDHNPAGVSDYLTVNDTRYILDLDVYVKISHSWVGDVNVRLTQTNTGASAVLMNQPGVPSSYDGCGGDNVIAIFDDQASQSTENQCAISWPTISGAFQPESPLAVFTGKQAQGQWQLTVSDNYPADTGSLTGWCLEMTVSEAAPTPTPTPPPVNLPAEASVGSIWGQDQGLELDCESRSAVDWARFFGTYIDEYDFFSRLPASDDPDAGFVGNVNGHWGQIPPHPYGVHAQPVAALLRDYGLTAYAHRYLQWDDLRAEIAAGRPAVVWVIGDSSGLMPGAFYPVYYTATSGHFTVVSAYEHTVIVTGYSENSVIILDGGKVYPRSLDQFLDSWGGLRNMAILARP